MDFKLIVDASVILAETPIWDERAGLYWTDLFAGTIHCFDPRTGEATKVETNELIGSAVPCETEGKVMAMLESGLYVVDMKTGEKELVVNPEPNRDENRFNDSRCDAKGRVFASSVAKAYGTDEYTPDMLGNFYMIDTDNTVTTLVEGINQYNAIVFDAKNENMFVIDTYNQTLIRFAYDLEKGPISAGEVVIKFDDMPDGMSIDTEDNLYVCHWNGNITVWNSKLELVEKIEFPVSNVCCGGFAGEDMKDYYVATSKYGQDDTHEDVKKGAGGIFVAKSNVAGRKDYYYKH